jgi:hypothetical protein
VRSSQNHLSDSLRIVVSDESSYPSSFSNYPVKHFVSRSFITVTMESEECAIEIEVCAFESGIECEFEMMNVREDAMNVMSPSDRSKDADATIETTRVRSEIRDEIECGSGKEEIRDEGHRMTDIHSARDDDRGIRLADRVTIVSPDQRDDIDMSFDCRVTDTHDMDTNYDGEVRCVVDDRTLDDLHEHKRQSNVYHIEYGDVMCIYVREDCFMLCSMLTDLISRIRRGTAALKPPAYFRIYVFDTKFSSLYDTLLKNDMAYCNRVNVKGKTYHMFHGVTSDDRCAKMIYDGETNAVRYRLLIYDERGNVLVTKTDCTPRLPCMSQESLFQSSGRLREIMLELVGLEIDNCTTADYVVNLHAREHGVTKSTMYLKSKYDGTDSPRSDFTWYPIDRLNALQPMCECNQGMVISPTDIHMSIKHGK